MKKSKDWESQVQNQVYHLHNNGQENWPLGFIWSIRREATIYNLYLMG